MFIALALASARAGLPQEPQGYLGARAVLSKMNAAPSGLTAKLAFANDLKDFKRDLTGMPAAEAASRWLGLLGRSCAIEDAERYGGQSGLTTLLPAIPSPDAWPLIRSGIDGQEFRYPARRLGIQLLMDMLQGDKEAAWTDVDTLGKLKPDAVGAASIDRLKLQMAIHWHDADRIEAVLTHEADSMTTEGTLPSNFGGPSIQIPDLISLLGRERARKLLTHILLTAKLELAFDSFSRFGGDKSTEDLARNIAIENKEQLAYPQWTLAASPDAGDMFEVFRRRFPKIQMGITWSNPPSGSTFDGAASNRFESLFLSGDMKRTERFAVSYSDYLGSSWGMIFGERSDFKAIEKAGKIPAFCDFIAKLAVRYPGSRLVDTYLSIVDTYLPLARQEQIFKRYEAVKGLQDYARGNCRSELVNVYLKEGKLKEAAELMAAPQTSPQFGFGVDAQRLVLLGETLRRPDLVKRGLDQMEQDISGSPWELGSRLGSLLEHGRGPEIEKQLIKQLVDSVRSRDASSPPAAQTAAAGLARFYDKIGRYADVVELLERFPKWDVPDLSYFAGQGADSDSFLLMAARALAKVGRNADALRILRSDIQWNPSVDEEYAILLLCGGGDTETILNGLAREFPTDSRPLIWKAKLLLREGRRSEAAAVARRAVTLDPDDLEGWNCPSRYLAYEVLAAANGRTPHRPSDYSQAAALEVKAAQFDQANIYGSAIGLYRRALALVPEDFRARMQLGVDLERIQQKSEGDGQVSLACRYMPAKWGNANRFLLDIYSLEPILIPAEKALRAEAKKGSQNAGVYAFLGEIGEHGGRSGEATALFRRAVQLDPDCLAAWSLLFGQISTLPAEYQAKVTANYLR
ncbi:MAG TPA: tetratricopeptide repeat protein, partial [Fimbriimonadaceae bacterium]|nr:tetratricopeptide repeat protein [Fimbriimonadaceae bacterium]